MQTVVIICVLSKDWTVEGARERLPPAPSYGIVVRPCPTRFWIQLNRKR
jgi:hypothetical protein